MVSLLYHPGSVYHRTSSPGPALALEEVECAGTLAAGELRLLARSASHGASRHFSICAKQRTWISILSPRYSKSLQALP